MMSVTTSMKHIEHLVKLSVVISAKFKCEEKYMYY